MSNHELQELQILLFRKSKSMTNITDLMQLYYSLVKAKVKEGKRLLMKSNLKRKQEQQIFDEIVVEQPPSDEQNNPNKNAIFNLKHRTMGPPFSRAKKARLGRLSPQYCS